MLKIAIVVGGVCIASIAHGQPALTPPVAAAEPAKNFIEAGVTAGGTQEGDLYAGFEVAAGYRLTDLIWLHTMAMTGKAPVIHAPGVDQYENTDDRMRELRGGIELRTCTASGALCAIGGVDVGYRYETFSKLTQIEDRSSAEAVARFGLDIGARNIRLRPVIEGTSTHTADTTALVIGLAYVW